MASGQRPCSAVEQWLPAAGASAGTARPSDRRAARRGSGTEADPASSANAKVSSCQPQFWTASVDPNFFGFLCTIEIDPLGLYWIKCGCLVRHLICLTKHNLATNLLAHNFNKHHINSKYNSKSEGMFR